MGKHLGVGLLHRMISMYFLLQRIFENVPQSGCTFVHTYCNAGGFQQLCILSHAYVPFQQQDSLGKGRGDRSVGGHRTLKGLHSPFSVCTYKGTCLRFSL